MKNKDLFTTIQLNDEIKNKMIKVETALQEKTKEFERVNESLHKKNE